jgi:hypothetical protein
MVHELCHTMHFNHSPEFWAMVCERMPEYRAVDAELRTAWRYVPAWVSGTKGPQGPQTVSSPSA